MYMEEGIRCNAIAPGGILTEMMFNMPEQNEKGTAKTHKLNGLLNRMGNPEDIAAAAVFLISDEANYISGQVLSVNGGWMCY